ncbi:MAG TPA: hypothetical protein VGE09_08580 [Pseudoxanthomonas sp.]
MSVFRLRRARAVAWSPHMLTRSVWRAAWDSDRADTITQAGGIVETWVDYLGGLAPTQVTEALRPTLDSSGGYPVISAAAGSRYLQALGGVINGVIPTGTDPSVIFVVARGFTTGNIVSWGGTSAASNRRLGLTGDGSVSLAVGSSGPGFFVNAPASVVAPTLITGVMTATDLILRVNGAEIGRVSGAMPSTGTNLIRLFSNTNGTAGGFGDGAISDLHITTALSDADILRFEGWLAAKRGLSLP